MGTYQKIKFMPEPNESTEPGLPDDKSGDEELRKKSKKTKHD